MSKDPLIDPRSDRPQWQFQTERKWSPPMISVFAEQTAKQSRRGEAKASDDLLRAIIDACVSNVAVLDETGDLIYANKAWHLFQQDPAFGADEVEFPHYYFANCKRFIPPRFEEEPDRTLGDDIRRLLIGAETEFHRQYVCEASIERRPFIMHAARLSLPGSAFRVLLTHEDIPVARDNSKQSRDRLTKLLDTTKILAWEGEVRDQHFTYVSDHASKMLGYPASDWYKPHFLANHIHPDDRQRVLATYIQQTCVSEHFDLTFRMLGRDSRVVWVQNLVSVVYQHGTATWMHGFMIDISERKRAEEALKYLGSRLIAAQEEERKRIARELHDDLNQRMAVLSIQLQQLGQRVHRSPGISKTIEKLQLQAQEISADIHRLSYKLHPSKLDHLGLGAAIKSLCEEISESQNGKLRVNYSTSGFPTELTKDVRLCIFRIAQEALRNCVKYSGAESVQVVLTRTEDKVRLSIFDNGCGFDTRSGVMEKGLGFISMKERLRLVDGAIEIWSQPRHGTRIEVSVPLDRRVDESPQSERFETSNSLLT